MKYENFNFTDTQVTIIHRRVEYNKTESGKSWRRILGERSEVVTPEFYTNFVQSIPFFNRLGTCRAQYNYTVAGYLPTVITSVSPDKTVKYQDCFSFNYN
jgi:hypothetical protein